MADRIRGCAPDEGRRVLELPPHDRVPLVEPQGQVPVALDPLGIVRVHDRLAGGPDGDGSLQLALPRPRHPRHLREGGRCLCGALNKNTVTATAWEHDCMGFSTWKDSISVGRRETTGTEVMTGLDGILICLGLQASIDGRMGMRHPAALPWKATKP